MEATLTQGNFYAHSVFRAPLLRPLRSIDFTLSKPTDGACRWQQLHGYPDMGIRLRFRDMGNDEVYGHVVSIIPHLTFYPYRREKWGVRVSHGTGLCYITKMYDEESNPSNLLISSHLNAASFLSAGLFFQPLSAWTASTTLEFSHESNGSFKIGNRGFNVWAAGISLRRNWNTPVEKRPRVPSTYIGPRWLFSVELSCGMHDYNAYARELQLTTEMTTAVWRQHSERFRSYLGLGHSIYPFSQIRQAVFLMAGEEVLLGRLSVRYSAGTYITSTEQRFQLIEKIGINYYPFKKRISGIARGIYFGNALKAHGSVAAHIEFMVGNLF